MDLPLHSGFLSVGVSLFDDGVKAVKDGFTFCSSKYAKYSLTVEKVKNVAKETFFAASLAFSCFFNPAFTLIGFTLGYLAPVGSADALTKLKKIPAHSYINCAVTLLISLKWLLHSTAFFTTGTGLAAGIRVYNQVNGK